MDRLIVYPGAIPLDTDVLSVERNVMNALGWLAQAALGAASGVVGLPCTPSVPASMTVNIGPGAIWAQSVIDQNNFGSLPPDDSPLMKMGILAEQQGTNFTLTAPSTSGQSINYLIEAAFEESDATPIVLPYVNPANPSQPYTGPNNSGTAQNTVRTQRVALQLKAGPAANTGTQATPAVDVGYVGLYVITVNFGQTTIIAPDITIYPDAPFTAGPFAPLAGTIGQNFAANALQANNVISGGGYSFNSTSFPYIYTDAENNLNIQTGSQNSGRYYQFNNGGDFKLLNGNLVMSNTSYFYSLQDGGIGMRVNSPSDYNFFIFNGDGTLQVNTPAPNFSCVPNLGQIAGLFSVSSDGMLWSIPNGQNANQTTVLTNTIQMGRVVVPSSGSWLAFPHAFPNRCLSIVATDGGATAYSYGFTNITQYGCNVYYNSPSGNNTEAGFDIIAIGN